MIDLHCHSYFSDGLLSPESLITQAIQASVTLLALTDHDTVSGLSELNQAAIDKPIQIIHGIEFSTRWKKHDLHVLGLNIQPQHQALKACILLQENRRIQRAQEIGQRLQSLGVNNAYEKACEVAGHTRVGRPHYAQILVREGKAKDTQAAFKKFLIRGRPGYVPTEWLDLFEIIDIIHQIGGVAVLAHPHKYKLTQSKLNALIIAFKHAGGDGMEVVSGYMMPAEVMHMAGLCQRYELLASSGSDFHGEGISRIGLGKQLPLPEICKPIWNQWLHH